MRAVVDFQNGTSIEDSFESLSEFNRWVMQAIDDFGPVIYFHYLQIGKNNK